MAFGASGESGRGAIRWAKLGPMVDVDSTPQSPAQATGAQPNAAHGSTRALRRFAAFALGVSLVAALGALVSGPGNRVGWWDYRWAFSMLGVAAGIGLVGALLSLVAGIWALRRHASGRVAASIIGFLVGILTFALPFPMQWSSGKAPPIHDISTDTENPPRFEALAALRAGVPNGVEYGGAGVATMQKAAYPDVASMTLAAPPEKAFQQCLQVGRSMGWEIVGESVAAGRIEATDTTVFFGFKDDIVLRVTPVGPTGMASRIDMRSVSRVGRSDRGVNARRVREFYRLLARSPITSR